MRTTSPKLDTSHLTANQEAELRCSTALEQKDRSEYDAAREAMFPLWNGIIGSRPNTKGLHDTVVAEVLLTTGILTGWLGSRSEIKEADDYARDLINESIRLYSRAIEVAHQAGALNRAGLAALTMIEEIDTLPREVQSIAFEQAREWLASSDSPDMKPRLKAVAKKINGGRSKAKPADVREVLFNRRYDLEDEVLKFERKLISETLAKVSGKVTHAAELLGVGYQRLAYIIETRHPDLLKKRTPVRRRPRKET